MRQPPGPLFFPAPIPPWPGRDRVPGIPGGRLGTACEAMIFVPARVPGDCVPLAGRAIDGRPRRPAGPVGPSPTSSPEMVRRASWSRSEPPEGMREARMRPSGGSRAHTRDGIHRW